MIGIVGCGNMGGALIKGLKIKSKKTKLIGYDKDRKKLSQIASSYKVTVAASQKQLVSLSKIIILAVKPQDIKPVLKVIKKHYTGQLIISIAAGISTSFIERAIAKRPRVIRVMPNLAAKVGLSLSALAKGKFARNSSLKKAVAIFKSVGSCIVLNEKYMSAFTAVAGSGPGFIFYFLYCLQQAARKLGFSEKQAHKLVFETIKGTAGLVSLADDFLKQTLSVASKGGTTQAGLQYLQKHNFNKIIEATLRQACMRAEKLSQ